MWTGRCFRLGKATVALEIVDGKRRVLTIPAESLLKVVSGPAGDSNQIVNVLWEGRGVEMFEIDLNARATEIRTGGAEADA